MQLRPTKRQLRRACRIEAIAAPGNLWRAAIQARKRKSRRPDVGGWWLLRESALNRLAEALRSGAWTPGGYRFFEVHHPKRRWIAAAPFEDRVVHHALCLGLQPLLERRFIARSYSCQVGKGTTAARDCCRRLTNRHRYVLKCDVSKFFHQIDHAILLEKLQREIRCPGVLDLCAKILDSFRTGDNPPAPLFPGDDLVEAAARARGLPIGNLTSQLWGNYYLDGLDHRIVETEGHGAYLRYTDDGPGRGRSGRAGTSHPASGQIPWRGRLAADTPHHHHTETVVVVPIRGLLVVALPILPTRRSLALSQIVSRSGRIIRGPEIDLRVIVPRPAAQHAVDVAAVPDSRHSARRGRGIAGRKRVFRS